VENADDLPPEGKARFIKYMREELPHIVRFFAHDQIHSFVINVWIAKCYNCEELSIWGIDSLLYPYQKEGIPPNNDMPSDIKFDYDEARTILNPSPRGASALLRLSVQKLCIHLDEKGEDLNSDIGNLVKRGLDPEIQRALDIVRVIGNEAVHPGQMDIKDDRNTALSLFDLVNFIVEQMISRPKKVSDLYGKLPQSKRDQIEKRDSKK
jgi:hypothetical protein